MEVTVKIVAPGLSEALLALAEQLQEFNAHQAGRAVPTEPITPVKAEVAEMPKTAPKPAKKQEKPVETNEKPQEPETEPAEESEEISLETVRALIVKSKDSKEKAKEIMTSMGVKKLTELNAAQRGDLYAKLQEVD